jgi:UDP-N-acetylmuramate dehydrogenase
LNLVTPENLVHTLREAVGEERVRTNVPLAPLTTFHVGGPADVLVETHAEQELHMVALLARGVGVPVTVLGGGSNVLIGDRGIRGVVVLVRDRSVEQVDEHGVRAAAGLTINGLVRWTVGRGLAGIEAWAGTPGTVGGAIHGNAHFRGRNISDLVREVRVLVPLGEVRGLPATYDVRDIPVGEMGFAYDTSRLKGSGEVALSAVFNVTPGKTDELRATARESLAFRKRTQPLDVPSAGCIFQNPDPARERVPDGIPPSAGALIDRAGLKGATSGGARVSPTHGNFIVHDGAASASEIRGLIERCKDGVASRYGVQLREEIVYLGEF